MAELTLTFSPPPCAELIATRFLHPRLKAAASARLGAYDRSFKWTAGVRALAVLLLRTAAWGRNGRDAHPEPPRLEGCRPSMAASLNDALTSKPRWIEDVFGVADGRPVLPGLLGRWNADFNTSPRAPVQIWVERDALPAEMIRVRVGDAAVEDPAGLSALADDIIRQRRPGREQSREGGICDPLMTPGAPSGMAVTIKLRRRVVAIEIELDRDFDTFGPDDEERLLQAIQAMVTAGREMSVRDRRRGSVILTVDLSPALAREVLRLAGTGALAHLGVFGVRRVLRPALPDVADRIAGAADEQLEDCLARWRLGDRSGLDELCRVTAARLRRLATALGSGSRRLRAWAETEDVIQASWVHLLQELTTAQPTTVRDFFSLAATALRRALIDVARDYRRAVAADSFGDDPSVFGEELEDLERWTRFHEAVGELPPTERELVGQIFYQGLSQERVAELWRVDPRTVRRRWSSACRHLQMKLGDLSHLSP